MALEDTLLIRNRTNAIATRYANLITADAARGASGVLNSRTGKTIRSFKPAIKTDNGTGWIYAFGLRARSVAFIQNYGQGPGTKSGGSVRQYTRTSPRGAAHTVRSHKRTIRAGGYLNNSMRKFGPRIAREMASAGSKAVARQLKTIIET